MMSEEESNGPIVVVRQRRQVGNSRAHNGGNWQLNFEHGCNAQSQFHNGRQQYQQAITTEIGSNERRLKGQSFKGFGRWG